MTSASMGGARGLAAKAPEKGVFPLDHFGECKTVMREYLQCLKQERGDSLECKEISRRYLACRMDNNLMAKEEFSNLGFRDKDANREKVKKGEARRRAKEGFIPGVR